MKKISKLKNELVQLTEVFVLHRMERRAVTLESLIVLQVGCGRTSGQWMTTEPWMIKV